MMYCCAPQGEPGEAGPPGIGGEPGKKVSGRGSDLNNLQVVNRMLCLY